MVIIGTRFFVWGAQRMAEAAPCGQCGAVAPFIIKKGMRFITVFFIIPLIPISGINHLVQCSSCRARYEVQPDGPAA